MRPGTRLVPGRLLLSGTRSNGFRRARPLGPLSLGPGLTHLLCPMSRERARCVQICAFIHSDAQPVHQFPAKPPGHQREAEPEKAENQCHSRGRSWIVMAECPTRKE